MAYNLQPLITILEGILDPHQSRWIVDENNPQLQSLLDKSTSLQQLLDKSSLMTKLDSQIREVAHEAEDILESHMVHHMLSGSDCVTFTLSIPNLQQVIRDLDSLMEQAGKLMEMEDKKMPPQLDSAMEELKLVDKKMPSRSSSSSKSVVVGIDADLMQLKEQLIGRQQKKLEIVPIVGMGGIGKTTIARKLYDDPLLVGHFAYRAWATVSQDYNMRQILLSLLSCIIKREEFDQHKHKGIHELKDMLYKSLYGRKYLIVLDDIWSTKLWDEMRIYIPDSNNGSRIVITTRESDVANYADSLRLQHQVQLLSESESWNLLYQLVFGEEDCPTDLQDIGQKISNDCSGLPLAISVIGGLLSKMERSKDVWKKIGNNVIAAIGESDEQCYNILSLSYNHLPNHLKPCFLYMGAYPEDYEIKGSTLEYMWVTEGFIKSNGERSLEEEAKDCLKSLVDRNLLLVRQYNKFGKPKRYVMHDMLRDICIRKCDEDKFLHVKKGFKVTFSNPRRLSLHMLNVIEDGYVPNSMSLTRSVIVNGYTEFLSGVFSMSRLLRVLDLVDTVFKEFPNEIFEFVNLRFLGVNCMSRIPIGISRLWNLQTLICTWGFIVPSELWQLTELRNLKVNAIKLLKDEEMNHRVMKMLQKISNVNLSRKASTWDGFFKSIPNIQKLVIDGEYRRPSTTIDLSHLHKLEIVRCRRIKTLSFHDGSDWICNVIFPCNIRKLVLFECALNSGVWRTLCALQKLEVLTLRSCTFKSEEEAREEESGVADGDESDSDVEFEREGWRCEEELKVANGDEFEIEDETHEEEWWKVVDGDEFEREWGVEFERKGWICEEELKVANGDGFESEDETHGEEWKVVDGDEFESEEDTRTEVWKVRGDRREEVWEVAEEDVFCSLKFLNLEQLSLTRWIADETNFPNLCCLCVSYCFRLEKIPSGIGEIPTLQSIELDGCRESAMASAKEIEEEQSEYGNHDLKLHIVCMHYNTSDYTSDDMSSRETEHEEEGDSQSEAEA